MTAGAITALTFRKLKQITINESLGVGKTCCIARRGFLAIARLSCLKNLQKRQKNRNFNFYRFFTSCVTNLKNCDLWHSLSMAIGYKHFHSLE